MSIGATAPKAPIYQLGSKALAVPMNLHVLNRKRLCKRIQQRWHDAFANTEGLYSSLEGVYILLQGGSDTFRGDSDAANVFRQESFFHWTFGGLEPDMYGAIEVATGKSILFITRIAEKVLVYDGAPDEPSDVSKKYAVDEVYYTDEMPNFFENSGATLLLTLRGLNSDSGRYTQEASFPGIERFRVNNSILHPEIVECRCHKTSEELEVLRYANRISSAAHRHLMRSVKPGMHEFEAESIFLHYCYFHGGMRHVAYTCIGASGCNCAILHYGHAGKPNQHLISDGDMCLFDMGGEYYCYTSDITCSFPANGRFTADQKLVYEAVLDASRSVLAMLKPGVSWVDAHKLAEHTILKHLLTGGLLCGSVDEMMTFYLGAIFMPHGLGHLMGCDVHDVGGYTSHSPARPEPPGLQNLRTARVLEADMVITVEPGCYFINYLLDKALADENLSKFIVPDVLKRFRNFGGIYVRLTDFDGYILAYFNAPPGTLIGYERRDSIYVRIEDNVLITPTGYELLTDVPRTVKEIEDWMTHAPSNEKDF